jgi:hypothetical protein
VTKNRRDRYEFEQEQELLLPTRLFARPRPGGEGPIADEALRALVDELVADYDPADRELRPHVAADRSLLRAHLAAGIRVEVVPR